VRVLLVNPAYKQTYFSYNRVLQLLGKKSLSIPLGIITLAALLPRNWEIRLAELCAREISAEDWDFCDVVMVTGMGVQSASFLKTIREAKYRGKIVVAGGSYVYHLPESVLKAGADIVVKGEAEMIVDRLLHALEGGDSGIIIQATGWADLEQSPLPRYDLLNMDDYIEMDVQFSRGCPFRCEFCDVTLMFGRNIRTKSPQQIITEFQMLYKLGWRKNVFIVDDNFIGSLSKTKTLLKEMIPWMEKRGHPFNLAIQATVNLAMDHELLDLLVQVGVDQVFLGIETLDAESLERTKKYQNLSVDIDAVCRKINRAGINIIAGCIIGFDEERPHADQRLIDFANRHSIPMIFATLLQIGPGTELYKRLEREGRIAGDLATENIGSQTNMINFIPTRPRKEIVHEFIRVYEELYEPKAFIQRAFKYCVKMQAPHFKRSFALPNKREMYAVLTVLFQRGILNRPGLLFWKYIAKMIFIAPKRIEIFMTLCIMGEHFYTYRHTIKHELLKQLSESDDTSIYDMNSHRIVH
jgi:radical SAM superfamily enzyme YgiQ (UPF0313 family)